MDVAAGRRSDPIGRLPLDYVVTETLRPARARTGAKRSRKGNHSRLEIPPAFGYLLKKLNAEELAKLPPTPEVLTELLARPGVSEPQRIEALSALAKARNSSLIVELLNTLEQLASTARSVQTTSHACSHGSRRATSSRSAIASPPWQEQRQPGRPHRSAEPRWSWQTAVSSRAGTLP